MTLVERIFGDWSRVCIYSQAPHNAVLRTRVIKCICITRNAQWCTVEQCIYSLKLSRKQKYWTYCIHVVYAFRSTVKHHITRFKKRDIRINRQRNVVKKLVKAFCTVNSAYINSRGLTYCQHIWIIVLFVPRCVVLDCIFTCFYKFVSSLIINFYILNMMVSIISIEVNYTLLLIFKHAFK